ncbi:hypothetical protein [Streptomyces sp. NBC_00859]|uniref:hypothetical protein n=1 Tax=Streptomyces sp. NBC_00859 TaxID=2903682 RepID=UPI003868D9E5|nr:hypothetical protein OG584_16725 [Streptomyces sp. NBC_00859]
MTHWIKSGVMSWLGEGGGGDEETVLVYFKGVGLSAMSEGLTVRHRPPFAHGNDPAPGDWGVIVHPMYNPSRDDFDETDHRSLCPRGAELMVFVPNPCVGKAHGPKAFHYKDGRISSCIDYEGPATVGEYWPNRLAPVITGAALAYGNENGNYDNCANYDNYEEQLTQLLCDHLGIPALDRGNITVDRELMAAYE